MQGLGRFVACFADRLPETTDADSRKDRFGGIVIDADHQYVAAALQALPLCFQYELTRTEIVGAKYTEQAVVAGERLDLVG